MSIVGDFLTDKVDGQLQAHLGARLKAVYQTVVEESLPERLRVAAAAIMLEHAAAGL